MWCTIVGALKSLRLIESLATTAVPIFARCAHPNCAALWSWGWSCTSRVFPKLASVKLVRFLEERDVAWERGEGIVAEIWVLQCVNSIYALSPVEFEKLTQKGYRS